MPGKAPNFQDWENWHLCKEGYTVNKSVIFPSVSFGVNRKYHTVNWNRVLKIVLLQFETKRMCECKNCPQSWKSSPDGIYYAFL